MRLVLHGHKMRRPPQTPTGIFKVCIEALTGFSHVFSPDGLNTYSLKAVTLEYFLLWEW